MNDLPWIKYEARTMYCDCADMSRECELAHRRLFDLLCILGKPIAGDDNTIREAGRVKEQDWMRVRGELERKGWHRSEDNGWIHAGTADTIKNSLQAHQARLRQTLQARLARQTDTKTSVITGDSVTDTVTGSVTSAVTKDVTETYLDLEEDLEEDLEREEEKDKAYSALSLIRGSGGESSSKPTKPTKATKLQRVKSEIAKALEDLLGPQWLNDAGKWINRIKRCNGKVERVLAELQNAAKEGRIATTPAQYAEQIWKEFT